MIERSHIGDAVLMQDNDNSNNCVALCVSLDQNIPA